ncbi:RNA polymerase sigma factor [Pseudoflavonifractor sp.]|jgi:RNA polymerase sigma factor (sigma-70 family)|uniref:RNA polymerase sigma factor n=1 Tax=Pseudoflavonifractor sp. TaxID=1980281 RepID=UPI003D93E5A4
MNLIEQVRLAQQGDSEAQTALYEAMYKRAYYLAFRMTRSAEDAEEAVQEAFLSAFRALPNLANPNAFEGWLFQITANKCRNVLSKSGRYTQLPEDEDGNTILDELPEENEGLIPASALENQAHREIILSIIEALPQQQKECVLLFYYSELTVAQIAQVLDCSEGTVKSRLNYARKKLRDGILETEERDGIRLHTMVPLGLLFLKDFQELAAGLSAAALSGTAAGAAAASSGTTAAGSGTTAGAAAKAGLFATVKAKVIAGVTAAALVAGGSALVLGQPKALAFTDPAMEANLRILLDKPEGAIYPSDAEELYALYIFDDGMAAEAGNMSQAVTQAESGTTPVSSLADLEQLPELRSLYYMSSEPALLDTLNQLPELRELIVTGENVNVSDFSFVSGMPNLQHISACVAGGADLSALEECVTLRQLLLWSEGSISLNAGKLTELLELELSGNQNGMQPESTCVLQLDQPLPQLLSLKLHGGELPSLGFLANTPALQDLDLYSSSLGQLDLGPIGGLKELRAVSLIVSYDQTLDLAPLADCPALEVYLAPNGMILNPPAQAVTDTESSLPLYNQVLWDIYDQIYAIQMGEW